MNIFKSGPVTLMFLLVINSTPSVYAGDSQPENTRAESGNRIFTVNPRKPFSEDEKKFFLSIGGWYSYNSGNTSTLNSNASASLEYRDGITEVHSSYKVFYKNARNSDTGNRETTEKKMTGIFKVDHYLTSRFEIFAFARFDNDKLSRLSFRNNSGAGIKFIIFNSDYLLTDLSGAPIFQYEKFEDTDPSNEARGSFRFRVKIFPFKPVKISTSAFYIPKFRDFENYRASVNTSLEIDIAELKWTKENSISMQVGYKREYNSRALSGTEKTDQIIFSRLIFKI